ncbi:MAG: ABC transporter ATP-binding protein, partial [Defluviicoccus sp.]|nr:ABC transporter ATP-binding protein [Defluviicoccus sp.]
MNERRSPDRNAAPLLQVRNLHTWFRADGETVRAVDGASFHVDAGETFCLVGESGSGKSVSALSVIGLLPADLTERCDGEILFRLDPRTDAAPRDLLRLPEEELMQVRGGHIAMIFQEPMTSLNPVFTVGDQIVEAIRLARPGVGYDEARRRAIEALAEVRIEPPELRVDEYPHRLSGGQRQRVMIAMAIACRPGLLIADEPTTALDVTVQAEILGLMQELKRRRGMSLFFITHDFGVVARIADRVAVMREGRIVETGTLEDVLERPAHAYTRQLLAAVPENLARTSRHHGAAQTRLPETPPTPAARETPRAGPVGNTGVPGSAGGPIGNKGVPGSAGVPPASTTADLRSAAGE